MRNPAVKGQLLDKESESPVRIDYRLEALVIPVSDVDRTKQVQEDLGWRLDTDFAFDNDFRVVQFTPLGSACSVQLGAKITSAWQLTTIFPALNLHPIATNCDRF